MKHSKLLVLLSIVLYLLLGCSTAPVPEPAVSAEPATPAAAAPAATAEPPATAEENPPDAVELKTAPLDAPIPFAPDLRTAKLANGLRYYVRVNKRPENRAELQLLVDAGSLQEDDDQQGWPNPPRGRLVQPKHGDLAALRPSRSLLDLSMSGSG